MPTVFISHSNQDHAAALAVVNALRRAGYDIWVDFENIRGGADWLCEIQAGIARCDAVVAILSKASVESVWVERECLYTFQLKKPLLTALVADVLIPLHLINIQYCDMRADAAAGVAKLLQSLDSTLNADGGGAKYEVAAVERQPVEANFFPYLEQLPSGDLARMVAQDLFYWALQELDEVAFGGRSKPGFRGRVQAPGRMLTLFSVWAYPKTPSLQLPLDRLGAHAPFDSRALRRATLKELNRLLPPGERFGMAKADRRPTFPLACLGSAEQLEGFKQIVLGIGAKMRGSGDAA